MIWGNVQNFYRQQIEEIHSDQKLQFYSTFLVLTHLWSAIFYYRQGLAGIITSKTETICWPLLSNCEQVNQWLTPFANFILPIYLLLFFGALFARTTRQKWWSLLVLETFKLCVQFLSYRFMGNYHFMVHIVTLFFLFVPFKNFWLKIWLISFYIGAATLKFNFEWLSGGSLSWKIPFQNEFLLQWSALIVLLLESLVPWLLLARNRLIQASALTTLVLFHLISYYWVGFFYPAMMLSILVIWFLDILDPKPFRLSALLQNKKFLIGFIPWLLFIAVQAIAMGKARDISLSGSDRLFTLNMFDARSDCRGNFIVHRGIDRIEVGFQNEGLSPRVKCDPIIFLEQGRSLCQNRLTPDETIEAHLSSKLWTDIHALTVIKERDLCQKWR